MAAEKQSDVKGERPWLPTLQPPKQNRAYSGTTKFLVADHHGQPVYYYFDVIP